MKNAFKYCLSIGMVTLLSSGLVVGAAPNTAKAATTNTAAKTVARKAAAKKAAKTTKQFDELQAGQTRAPRSGGGWDFNDLRIE